MRFTRHISLIAIAIAIGAAVPSRAGADAGLPLMSGQGINLRFGTGATASEPRVVGIFRATLDDYGKAAAERLAGVPCKSAMCEAVILRPGDLGVKSPPPPARDTIKLSFVISPETRHTLFVIENGYDRAFVYRATITRDGKASATDVCLVMPQKRGYEDWPYIIEKIELTAMSLQPWTESDGVPCA